MMRKKGGGWYEVVDFKERSEEEEECLVDEDRDSFQGEVSRMIEPSENEKGDKGSPPI